MTPKIGVPRVYAGSVIPLLYPGEQAVSRSLPVDELIATSRAGDSGMVQLEVQGWLVEPDPSWRGWYRRWRYRLIGRFISGGPPNLSVAVSVVTEKEPG